MTITECENRIAAVKSSLLVFKAMLKKYRELIKNANPNIQLVENCNNFAEINVSFKDFIKAYENGSEITKTIEEMEKLLPHLHLCLERLKKGEKL